jgi:hypothetical protein
MRRTSALPIRPASIALAAACAAALWAVPGGPAAADDVRPVQIQLREREPGMFLIRWQVPQVLERAGMPSPRLPADCAAETEITVQEQPGSWDSRQTFRCADSLAGREIVVEFPRGNPALSTVIRLQLLSGERFATMLQPGEYRWTVPAPPRLDAMLREIQAATLVGIRHATEYGAHLALLLAIVALGDLALATRFGAGQLAAAIAVGAGIGIDPRLGEILLAVGAAVMANAVLRPGADSSALRVVALLAGSGHGLGWLSVSPGIGTALLAALGLDAVMVGLAAAAIFTFRRVPGRAAMAYAAGVLAVAFGLAAWSSPAAWSVEPVLDASRLPTAQDEGSGASASRRLAPQAQETPVQSFVAVGAFEVRNEVLLRARDLAATLGLEARDEIPIAAQPDIKAAAAELIRGAQVLEVNGAEVVAAIDRVDFMVVETQGVLPRQVPVVENVDGAYIGVTLSTLTPRTPTTVSWTWTDFSIAAEIPVTLTDPEISRATTLSADSATLRWNNQLSEDPVPTVDAIRVEPTRAALPLLSIVLLGGAVALLWARRRDAHGTVLLRVSLVGALLVAPLGDIPVALPFTRAPTEGQARRILAGVLPNVYRALEFRDEARGPGSRPSKS